MKSTCPLVAAVAACVALLGCADAPSALNAGNPPATHAATVTPVTAPKFSVASTPIEVLGADPGARAAVLKQFPKLFDHPAYSSFKAMSLAQLKPYSQGALSDEGLAALQLDLDRLP